MNLLAFTLIAAVSSAPPPADVAPLVESEHAFARDVAARGIRDGFLAHLAPKAILFRPGPVDAQAWLTAQKSDTTARLRWEASYAEMSTGGDLGWTTGPWDYARSAGEDPVAFGHFTTVWRRQGDDTWRAEIDTGHDHAKGAAEPLTWSRVSDAARRPRAVGTLIRQTAEDELFQVEMEFARLVSRQGYARAVAKHASEDLRVGRNGSPPWRTRDAAAKALKAEGKSPLTSCTVTSRASEAGDLGYTYGTLEPEGGTRLAYLHIWRRVDGEPWRLAHDVTIPAPEPEAAKP